MRRGGGAGPLCRPRSTPRPPSCAPNPQSPRGTPTPCPTPCCTSQIAAARDAVKAQKSAASAARTAAKLSAAGGASGASGGGPRVPGGRAARLRAARLLRKAEQLLEEMGAEMATTWNGFLGVMDILEDMGAIGTVSPGDTGDAGGGEEGEGGGGAAAGGGRVEIQPLGLLARSLQVRGTARAGGGAPGALARRRRPAERCDATHTATMQNLVTPCRPSLLPLCPPVAPLRHFSPLTAPPLAPLLSQGENQLWMAVALSHPSVMNLTGPQLAGYISALVCSEVIRRPMSVWTPYQVGSGQVEWKALLSCARSQPGLHPSQSLGLGPNPCTPLCPLYCPPLLPHQVSPEVLAAIEDLEPAREALFEAQTAAGMVRWNESLLIDLRFAGKRHSAADLGAGYAIGGSPSTCMTPDSMLAQLQCCAALCPPLHSLRPCPAPHSARTLQASSRRGRAALSGGPSWRTWTWTTATWRACWHAQWTCCARRCLWSTYCPTSSAPRATRCAAWTGSQSATSRCERAAHMRLAGAWLCVQDLCHCRAASFPGQAALACVLCYPVRRCNTRRPIASFQPRAKP